MYRRALLFGSIAAATLGGKTRPTAAATLLPLARLQERGPFSVASRDEIWRDGPRGRDVLVRIRIPRSPAAPIRGIVLFSSGSGGSLDSGTAWTEHWASWGYVTLNLQHRGSDVDWWRDRLRQGKSIAQLPAPTVEQHVARIRDVALVIDELQRRSRAGDADLRDLDAGRIGMAGHSLGSDTTLSVAGESTPGPGGFAARARNPRVVAALAMSPFAAGPETTWPRRFATVQIPCMMLTGTLDGDGRGSGAPPVRRLEGFKNMPPGDKFLAVLPTADHAFFDDPNSTISGRSVPGANGARSRNTAAVRGLSVAFWNAFLAADTEMAQALHDSSGIATLVAPGTYAAH